MKRQIKKRREIKAKNNWRSIKVFDLQVLDCILFPDEPDDAEGHVVVCIYQYGIDIIVEYVPEWTDEDDKSFKYGEKKFRLKE